MNRRGFLRALGIGAGAIVAAPLLKCLPLPRVAVDPMTGISLRFVRQYNVIRDQEFIRIDVLYGMANLNETHTSRVIDADYTVAVDHPVFHPDAFALVAP